MNILQNSRNEGMMASILFALAFTFFAVLLMPSTASAATLNITNPTSGEVVSGSVSFDLEVTDNTGTITGVFLGLEKDEDGDGDYCNDGASDCLGGDYSITVADDITNTSATANYTKSINTGGGISAGNWRAQFDVTIQGSGTERAFVNFIVNGGPEATNISPAEGAYLSGSSATISADVTDPDGVTGVDYRIIAHHRRSYSNTLDEEVVGLTAMSNTGGDTYEATFDPSTLPATVDFGGSYGTQKVHYYELEVKMVDSSTPSLENYFDREFYTQATGEEDTTAPAVSNVTPTSGTTLTSTTTYSVSATVTDASGLRSVLGLLYVIGTDSGGTQMSGRNFTGLQKRVDLLDPDANDVFEGELDTTTLPTGTFTYNGGTYTIDYYGFDISATDDSSNFNNVNVTVSPLYGLGVSAPSGSGSVSSGGGGILESVGSEDDADSSDDDSEENETTELDINGDGNQDILIEGDGSLSEMDRGELEDLLEALQQKLLELLQAKLEMLTLQLGASTS